MKRFAFPITALGLVAFTAWQPVRPVVINGVSMSPTLHNGQVVMGRNDFSELKRGDVVVADTPDGVVVKRVAFLPGDRIPEFFQQDEWVMPVSFQQGRTFRNGHAVRRVKVVPAGTVFLLGDNVNHSIDSRNYGPVSIESVRLKVEGLTDNRTFVPGSRYAKTQSVGFGV